nr:group II intron reverse transcriptase/maturase [uncultured Desulfobacter sp.]
MITIDGRKNPGTLWSSINWNQVRQVVNRLQTRIVKAVKAGNKEKVRSLQRLLARSLAGRLLAVKRVSENRGKRTAGVDNKLLDTPAKRWQQACHLNRKNYKSKPLKRLYIPKKNGKKRPLGIPVMHDRAEQALELSGLEPVFECTSDNHSYGFRKKRSVHDAISACFNALRGKGSAQWILEGDIKGCFDHISHDWMIEHIPMNKRKLNQWLKSGYLEKDVFYPTAEGTPQGGIISPTLANMALDGLQELLSTRFKKQDKVHLVRYADDFIVTGNMENLLSSRVKPIIVQFLKERGLELSAEKTRISHINEGFNFLGFNIRKYKDKLLIKPSKSGIISVKQKIKDIITANKAAKTDNLIAKLNPLIRGWGNYYRHVVSQHAFDKIDSAMWEMTWQWAKRRHPNKSLKWIKSKYFQRKGPKNWVFREKNGNLELFSMSSIPIRRHIKIKANANPYDPHWKEYFDKRSKRSSAGCLTAPYQCLSPVR